MEAFARVLAEQGYAGATIAAVAQEAELSPGLLHHHFRDKRAILDALFSALVTRFRGRVSALEPTQSPLGAYVDGALALGALADRSAARCWVGIFAEAARDPALRRRLRRFLDGEVAVIARRSGGRLSDADASAVLAFIIGALVLGAFAPRKTAGFAAPALHRIIQALQT